MSCDMNRNGQLVNETPNSGSDWRVLKPTVGLGLCHSFQSGLYTDVLFKVGSTADSINAHKSFLMIRSEVFAQMFTQRMTRIKGDHIIVNIPNHSPINFTYFIKFLYTDELPQNLSVQSTLEILDLGHSYKVPGLISKCSEFLEIRITECSCIEIYQRTRKYTQMTIISYLAYNLLKRSIREIALSNKFLDVDVTTLKKLLQSDNLAVDELLLFHALLRWSKVEGTVKDENGKDKSRAEVTKSLIPLIRFLLITPEDFATEVVPTKVLSDSQALEIICYRLDRNQSLKETNELMEGWAKPRLHGLPFFISL